MVRPSFLKDNLNLKEKIIEFLLYNEFSSFLRRLKRFILRLFRWIPVLWNQEEWDYEYVYDLLEMKMKELRENISKDTWHESRGVKKRIKQIDVCLRRLDMWRNWTEYYEYPTDDIIHTPTDNGCYKLEYTSEKNEKQRLGAIKFEQKNYDKFWKNFLAWHQGWWT